MKKIVSLLTYDNNEQTERKRCLDCIKEFRNLGLTVITSDKGSSEEFISSAKSIGVKFLNKKHTSYGDGIKQSLQAAYEEVGDEGIIIRSEGDKSGKYGFQNYLSKCLNFFDKSGADITLIARTKKSIKTYPAPQQFTEKNILNFFYSEVLSIFEQRVEDFCYGPLIMKGSVAKHFLSSKHENFAICLDSLIKCAELGLKINEFKIDMEFTMKEEISSKKTVNKYSAYRLMQVSQDIVPIIDFWAKKNPDYLIETILPILNLRLKKFHKICEKTKLNIN